MNAGSDSRPGTAVARGHAVAVLVITPQGIPLIRDPKKPAPVLWKTPGGRGAPGESPAQTAVREIKEEIGITLSGNDLTIVHQEDRESHTLVLFAATLTSLPPLKTQGDEGEEIKIFSPKEILAMRDFFPNHRKAFEELLAAL